MNSKFEQNKFIVINRKRFEELAAAVLKNTNELEIKCANRYIDHLESAISMFQELYEEKTGLKMDQKYYVCNQDEPYAQEVIDCILNNGKDTNG